MSGMVAQKRLQNFVDEWLHAFFYFNDETPTEAAFEKAIGEYLTFEFSMIMQNRDYLFENEGGTSAED